MTENRTIAAIATPPGIGALAIIRISGIEAFSVASSIIFEKQKFEQAKPRSLKRYTVFNTKTNTVIDDVTAIKFSAPASFTGEDLVEIISHGGFYTVKNIMDLLVATGAVLADRGEFSKKAFINGKLDLMKAEAINAIIESRSEKEYSSAINCYSGLYKKLSEWYEKIQDEISFAEAEIEFGEVDGIPPRPTDTIKEILFLIQEEIHRNQKFKEIRNGITVVLAGPPNTGKSTLFNYFLGYKRSIVHDQPGTTRDSISANITINENDVVLFDTAGLRATDDLIENEGILISKEVVHSAHLVLWVSDCSEKPNQEEITNLQKLDPARIIILLNKVDKGINKEKVAFISNNFSDSLQISVKNNINLQQLISMITKTINRLYSETKPPDIFINERHQNIAENIQSHLQDTLSNWEHKEIASYFLRKALFHLEEIFGKTDNESIINNIFSKFCIGK